MTIATGEQATAADVLAQISTTGLVASANVRNSNNASKNTTSLTYVKLKETKLNAILSAVRIKFYAINPSNGTGTVRLYKNGVAFGTEHGTSDTGDTFSEDFTGLVTNDLIQLYAKTSNGIYATTVQDLHFCYDKQIIATNLDTLATPIITTTDPTISMTNQDP